jgi:hypothetical protein
MELCKPDYKPADYASWFAVQVKTTHEKRVTSLLDFRGYEWFLPLYTCRRRWSDRIKKVALPLFEPDTSSAGLLLPLAPLY